MLRVMNGGEQAAGGGHAGPRWLVVAPADRAAGRRGLRGVLAAITAPAALLALAARGFNGSGGGSDGPREFSWKLDGPDWTNRSLLVVAAALVLAALLLWAARRPWTVALGVLLVPLALGTGVISVIERQTAGRVTSAEVREARTATTETAVREMLGQTAGHGSMRLAALRADCAVYVASHKDRFGDHPEYLFCFRDGRVVGRWPALHWPLP
jgi:hypothetical protein